jgi:hypothetical protein
VVTDVYPGLKKEMPRGWSKGDTWDQAEGLYDRVDKAIVATELRKTRDGTYRPGRRTGVLEHETGHAFDQALDVASSNDSRFVDAYVDDLRDLNPRADELRDKLGYYLQTPPAGQQEAFAEVFGAEVLNRGAADREDIRQYFPRVTQWMREAIKTGQRPTGAA